MVIEESVSINAPIDKVWKMFTDLTCWQDWNSVLTDVSSGSPSIEKGGDFRFCLRPFFFPVNIEPFIEEVIPHKLVVWAGSKFGIFARHEFLFEADGQLTTIKSRESFKGITVESMPLIFPEKVIRKMTRALLRDIKRAVEN